MANCTRVGLCDAWRWRRREKNATGIGSHLTPCLVILSSLRLSCRLAEHPNRYRLRSQRWWAEVRAELFAHVWRRSTRRAKAFTAAAGCVAAGAASYRSRRYEAGYDRRHGVPSGR